VSGRESDGTDTDSDGRKSAAAILSNERDGGKSAAPV
jgi:hypothetical protein